MQAVALKRPPLVSRIFTVVVRTLFITLLFTMLGMALGLLAGIFITLAGGVRSHTHADMRLAYLHFAIPTAITFGAITLIYNVANEIRRAIRKEF